MCVRAAQGSRLASSLWGRLAALVMRLTQSLFSVGDMRLMSSMDDTLANMKGTTYERKLRVAVIIVVWEAVKFRLAYCKGQLGQAATLIGGTVSVTAADATARVKDGHHGRHKH